MMRVVLGMCWLLSIFVSPLLVAQESLSDLDLDTLKQQAKQLELKTPGPFSSGVSTASDLAVEDLVLMGIALNNKEQYALISGYVIRPGDRIAGYRVASIEPTRVVLKRLDEVYVLPIEGGL